VPLHEVEPAADIVRRFSTGAMSHGSLSKEAHETLSEAMNLLGGSSNCGEGGEDPARFRTRGQARGDKNSKIKQIAVGPLRRHARSTPPTPTSCRSRWRRARSPVRAASSPGHKVSEEIARPAPHQPGVALISPPPHHDIYSIEDLAQLIFDLKQVNGAEVS
jgi:glutamate synthase domain-containing protein 2